MDTELSHLLLRLLQLLLVSHGAHIPKTGVAPLPIVPHLDEFKERRAGGEAGREVDVDQELVFERCEEALDYCVVPAVAPTTHAAGDPMSGQQRAVRRARILAPAIGMMQQTRRRPALRERHVQR